MISEKEAEGLQASANVVAASSTVLPEPPKMYYGLLQQRKASSELAPYLQEEDLGKLVEALSVTIKEDNANKVITYLGMLSAITDHDSFNIIFKADSSTGKSYIALEVAKYFPASMVKAYGYVSPTAFFHDFGEWDPDQKANVIDLSGTILIFKDQPHDDLLKRLRSYLSHDDEQMEIRITDRSERKGLRTKRVILKGKPPVIFCSARLRLEEQEATRAFLLSPEVTQEKLRASISLIFQRETDNAKFQKEMFANPLVQWLNTRTLYLSELRIRDVIVPGEEAIKQKFLEARHVTARAQRDARRLIYLVKAAAIFNVWSREVKEYAAPLLTDHDEGGLIVTASDKDVEQAELIYSQIAEAQELGLPPQTVNLFKKVLQPLLTQGPADYRAIQQAYYAYYHGRLGSTQLAKDTLPSLQDAGLITLEPDPLNRRRNLVTLT